MNKKLHCGECDKLLYEDACGYGECKVNGDKCYCGDLCHLIHGKAMKHFDFDLCDNEQCNVKEHCLRYKIYKQGGWHDCYVMHGCIGYTMLKG